MPEHGQTGDVVLVDAMMASTYGCNTVGVCQNYWTGMNSFEVRMDDWLWHGMSGRYLQHTYKVTNLSWDRKTCLRAGSVMLQRKWYEITALTSGKGPSNRTTGHSPYSVLTTADTQNTYLYTHLALHGRDWLTLHSRLIKEWFRRVDRGTGSPSLPPPTHTV